MSEPISLLTKGVDPRALDLAKHFLADFGADNTGLADLLAEHIQGAVEDWIEEWFVDIVPTDTIERAKWLAEGNGTEIAPGIFVDDATLAALNTEEPNA